MSTNSESKTFAIRRDRLWKVPLTVIGANESNSRVVVGPSHIDLEFGSYKSVVKVDNIESVEDQQSLRQQIVGAGLTAFVRDGAILPRNSGDTDTPMRGSSVVAFRSPEAMTREFKLPNCGAVRGMAIPRGVTLIVGGGFHGKSTLLQALELGVYDHIPGDGREFVVTDPTAVKVGLRYW